MKRKWHHQPWFLCILFILWPLVIPVIIGIVQLVGYYKEEKEIRECFNEEDRLRKTVIDEEDSRRAEELENRDREIEEDYHKRREKLDQELEEISNNVSELRAEYIYLTREIAVESVEISSFLELKSDEIKNELQMLRMAQTEMIKNDQAVIIIKALNKPSKYLVAKTKQMLRCFNAESSNIIESVTVKNVDTCRSKLQRCFDNVNKVFSSDADVLISSQYFKTKLDELSMLYAYMIKVEQEKELQREIREQLKEEEKVRREIEQEKVKIEKEEAQFNNEINKLIGYMQKASDIEKQLYVDKIRELEEKLKLLEKDRQNVLEREQNTRAGFVYIISNIGSFGENVYKIGMTRRLEPMDRIRELSSASVPFSFDLHAMIFSEDAPALETTLHQTFRDNQVNKVNTRKEFFKVDFESIKNIVKKNHNATVQFIDIPDAIEYRETLRKEETAV